MAKVEEPDTEKPGFWDTSPLSPPWTIAVVFLLIVFVAVAVKISLSG